MKIIKYIHDCIVVEKDETNLVIDPGSWSTDFVVPDAVVAIVITHEHPDHFARVQLEAIRSRCPEVVVYAPASVTSQLSDFNTQTVLPGDTIETYGFTLRFIGGAHATIHQDYHPPFKNIGVIVNDTLYHPGDSLIVPDQPITVLALPIVAPWEKIAESIDFLTAVKPRFAFPCHDAILSAEGRDLYDRWHATAAERCGATYQRLHEPIEVDG